MADLQKLVVRLEAETAKFQRELDKAQKKLGAFQRTTVSSVDGIKRAFLALGGITALTAFAKRTLDAGDNLAKMSQKVGVSVESLSRLAYAADLSGVSIDSLGTSMARNARFAADLERGLDKPRAALDALGISAREYLDASPEERLLLVAKAFREHEDGSGKAAAAMEMFGRSGADLIPFLNEGPEGIRKLTEQSDALGHTWDTKTAKAFEAFNDNVSRLSTALAASLRPALNDIVAPLDEIAVLLVSEAENADKAEKSTSDLATALKVAATAALSFWHGLVLVGDFFGTSAGTGIATFLGGMTSGEQAFEAGIRLITEDLEKGVARWDAIWAEAGKNARAGARGAIPKLDPFSDVLFEGDAPLRKPKVRFGDEDAASSADRAAKAIQGMIASLEAEAATLGMTAAQAKLYDLSVAGATDAQLAHAQAVVQTIDAFEMQQEAMQDAQEWDKEVAAIYRANEALFTADVAAKAYGDTIEELNVLLREGVISHDQYVLAAEKASEQLDTYANAVKAFSLNLREDIKQSTSGLFQDLLTDSENWKDHLLDYLSQIGDAFAKMAADMAAQALFGTTGGTGGGINWGGLIAGLVGSAAGGAAGGGGTLSVDSPMFAAGGVMQPGRWSLVGEEGPELVMSHNAARVFNADDTADMIGGGGRTLIQNFAVKDFDSFNHSRKQTQGIGRRALGI